MQKIVGKDNIIQLLCNILDENTGGTIRSILSGKPLVYYFGEEFSEQFMQKRVENNISLQSLRRTGENFDMQKHRDYDGYLKEVQHLQIDEKIDGDVVFLFLEKVIIFYVVEMRAEIFEEKEIFQKYNQFFEKYWS